MKTADAIEYFGSKSELARALGISASAVSGWGGKVPELRALQLDVITAGKLKTKLPSDARAGQPKAKPVGRPPGAPNRPKGPKARKTRKVRG